MVTGTISHYRILKKLGEGGMGEVYLAEDVRLGRRVALKLLLAEFTTDEQRVRRFRQEARAASALNHPNILTIYDIGEIDSLHFIATEFVKGATLRERISSSKMNPREAIDVTIQVANALAVAHQAGIVHRDIKPENVMLRPDGYVKVLDFGLAKLIERCAPIKNSATAIEPLLKTEPGLLMGTPKYMSPEQVRGLSVDGRTDIFSLGVFLYEMITGRPPFEGRTISDLIAGILEKDPVPMSQHCGRLPFDLQRVVDKSLRKAIENRYQTAENLLLDLKGLSQKPSKKAPPEYTTELALDSATIPMGSKQPRIETAKEKAAASISVGVTLPIPMKPTRKRIDSLAILPLANASADPNLEYLSDGITETIINRLSKLPKLRVMARSTVFRYKGRAVDPQQVGRDLSVRAILTGRLLLLGSKLIIGMELVDVLDGSQLWGEQYNRELSDVFVIGGEISKEISDKLELRLTGEERKRLAKRYTESSEAYHLYLKGRYFLNKFTGQTVDISDLKSAEDLFKRAIESDSNFVLAHSSLGVCYLNHVLKGIGGVEYYSKAKESFDRALVVDPQLVEPLVRMVYIDLIEGRSEEARQQIQKLLRRAPNEPSVHSVAAYVYRLSGQYRQALRAWDRLLTISPTDIVFATSNRARIHIYRRDWDKAAAELAMGLAFEPHHPLLRAYVAVVDYYRGQIEKATLEMEDVLAKNPELHSQKLFLAYCYFARGENERALALVDDRVLETARADQDIAYRLATVYALANKVDEAIEWLERSISMGNENYPWVAGNPNWGGLRDEPRFKKILEDLKARWEKLSEGGD